MDYDAGAAGRAGQLDWLLDDLVRRVGHVTKAVILSQDGMALGASQTLGRDDAEHLAALAAGFQSLARGAERHFGNGGGVRQTIIEMESGFLLTCAAGSGTSLAVITEPGALAPEHMSVLALARAPTTVADIASDLDLPLGVIRIILADLRELGLVAIRAPVVMAERIDKHTLREVLNGLRGL